MSSCCVEGWIVLLWKFCRKLVCFLIIVMLRLWCISRSFSMSFVGLLLMMMVFVLIFVFMGKVCIVLCDDVSMVDKCVGCLWGLLIV